MPPNNKNKALSEITIAIHEDSSGFSPHWVNYCIRKKVPHIVVNCYDDDIIEQVRGCSALLWHYSHSDPRDILIARQIHCALEHAGLTVFPDFQTAWHFDDKVGQKYLFEAVDIPRPQTYVFVEKATALEWASTTSYPKVFKLRHGASSSCVRIVRDERQARRLIRQAFGRGLPVYSPWENLKDRIYKWRLGKSDTVEVAKGVGRFFRPPRFSKLLGRQIGYVLFQDFAPDNDSDLRMCVIGDRAFGVRRWVRPGDFRASGSQRYSYEPEEIDIECVALSFKLAKRLSSQCLAFDFVRMQDGSPAVIEVSYGFGWRGNSPGYWDSNLQWHACDYRPEEWMVDLVLETVAEDSMRTKPERRLGSAMPVSSEAQRRTLNSDD